MLSELILTLYKLADTFKFLSDPLVADLTELYLDIGPFGFQTFKQTQNEEFQALALLQRFNINSLTFIPRFNTALRKLSQQLSILHISGLFPLHPDLFYPTPEREEEEKEKPHALFWPHLRELKIQSTIHKNGDN